MISVVVPIYQIEEYLPTCIESILKQTYHDLEIILVDDGSEDKSPQICDVYAERDSRIKVIHKENGGLVSARIAGLKMASGEFVTYVDGDDWIDVNYYERLIEDAQKYHVDVVASGFTKNIGMLELSNKNALPCGYYSQRDIKEKIFPVMFYDEKSSIPGLFTYVWNKLFRREFIYKYQLFVNNDITIGEDAACVYPAIIAAGSIYINDNEGYHYRQRTGSMLKQHAGVEKELLALKVLFDSLIKAIKPHKHEDVINYGLQRFMQYMIVSRTGGLFEHRGKLFSVYDVDFASKVIVYGAGNVGQHLYRNIISRTTNIIKYWIDPDFAIYKKEGLPVDDLRVLEKYDGEDVFLAFLKETEIKDALQVMDGYNIPSSKIHLIDINKINLKAILRII